MFFVYQGKVYHLSENGEGQMLETHGMDEPWCWTWAYLSALAFGEIHRAYIAECNERNRFLSPREFEDR